MRVERWPGGDFELEPGDLVRISHPGDADADGVRAEVVVGRSGEEKTLSWIPAGPKAVAMYLGEADEAVVPMDRPTAQVLHEGRILNVCAVYLQPER